MADATAADPVFRNRCRNSLRQRQRRVLASHAPPEAVANLSNHLVLSQVKNTLRSEPNADADAHDNAAPAEGAA